MPAEWDLPSFCESYDALQLSLYDPLIALLRQSQEHAEYLSSVSAKAERIRSRCNTRKDEVLSNLRRQKQAQGEEGKRKKKKSSATKKSKPKNKRTGRSSSCSSTSIEEQKRLDDILEEAVRELSIEDLVEECAICLFELEDDGGKENRSSKTLECGHVFHRDYISLWLLRCEEKKLGVSCPYCRQELEAQDVLLSCR